MVEHEQILSQEFVRKRDMKFSSKGPKISLVAGDYTDFTSLTDRMDLFEDDITKMKQFYEERDQKQ